MEQRIIINGRALNAKLGAIVQTDRKDVVYIAGLHDWDDSILGELIQVTGIPIPRKLPKWTNRVVSALVRMGCPTCLKGPHGP